MWTARGTYRRGFVFGQRDQEQRPGCVGWTAFAEETRGPLSHLRRGQAWRVIQKRPMGPSSPESEEQTGQREKPLTPQIHRHNVGCWSSQLQACAEGERRASPHRAATKGCWHFGYLCSSLHALHVSSPPVPRVSDSFFICDLKFYSPSGGTRKRSHSLHSHLCECVGVALFKEPFPTPAVKCPPALTPACGLVLALTPGRFF